MKVHSLEHAPFEGAGKIADWARSRGHVFTSTQSYLGEAPPAVEDFDLLIIMGGAMNAYQYRDYPWLLGERKLIVEAVIANKSILGICLGAQMLADVLGARVHQNPEREIGWLPVRFIDREEPFDRFPEECSVFHWHGDTFELPPGARRVAVSAGCANQGFIHGDRRIGLQFHIEVTPEAVAGFVAGAEHELLPARFVQTPSEIVANPPDLRPADEGLFSLLDSLARRIT